MPPFESAITDQDALRDYYGAPSELAVKKQIDYLDRHCRNFIALSPFVVIGSQGADGRGDVSPRGDAPGFVQVLDDRTLAIPDRPGNNRVDTLSNVLDNPAVGLLFLVPGMNETLRVNGRARLVLDETLLEAMVVQGKTPRAALVVEVEEAYLQCAKALYRSKLWEDDHKIERRSFPSLARVIADQAGGGIDVEAADARVEEAYRTKLY